MLKIYKYMGFFIKLLLVLMIFFYNFFPGSVEAAQGSFHRNTEYYDDEDSEEEESLLDFELRGFIEFENFTSTDPDQESRDAIKKNEIRNNIKLDFGGENLKFKVDMNMYINSTIFDENKKDEYIYSDDLEISNNLRLSDSFYEISFNELFISYELEYFRFRVGNQIYGWGTADATNPTSYFNPMDSRELFFKSEDEMKISVPSVSGMIFIGDYTVETVFVPVHVPMLVSERGTYWEIKYWEGPFPIRSEKPDALGIEVPNFAYGGRISRSILGSDISISGYHGPDNDPALRPLSSLLTSNETVALLVNPVYTTVNYVGIDFTSTLDMFVLQFEAAYSPNKTGVVDQGDVDDISDPEDVDLPFDLRKGHYISYSAGFNYFIPLNRILDGHEGETVLTVEWHEAFYFDCELMPPIMTDFLITRIQDNFFSNYFNISVTAIMDLENNGMVFMPDIGLDFQNGLTLNLTYASIHDYNKGKSRSLFGFYKDNDIVTLRLKYEY